MRFVMAQRRSQDRISIEDDQNFDQSLANLERVHTNQLVTKAGGSTRRMAIFESDSLPVTEPEKAGLIVEPLLPRGHRPVMYGAPEGSSPTLTTAATQAHTPTQVMPLRVDVIGDGNPIAKAEITLVLAPQTVLEKVTGSDGRCVFQFDSGLAPTSISSSPLQMFWTVAKTSPSRSEVLDLPPIKLE